MSDGRGALIAEEVVDLGTLAASDRVLLRRRVVPLMPVHLGVLRLSNAGLLFVCIGRCLVRGHLARVGWQTKVKLARLDLFVSLEA